MKIARPKGVLYAWQQAIRNDDSLTSRDKFVALMCSTFMDGYGSGAFPEVKTIAACCSYYDKKPVHKALKTLEVAGYFTIERRTGRTSIYTACFPEGVGVESTQVDGEADETWVSKTPGGGGLERPPGGGSEHPLPVHLPIHLSGAHAPATESPTRALEQLRDLVTEHKTLDAYSLPDAVRRAAAERFRGESNRLLRVCAEQPSFDGARL